MLTVLVAGAVDGRAEIVVGGLDFFGLDDGLKDVLRLEITPRAVGILALQLIERTIDVLKVLVDIGTELMHLLVETLDLHIDFCLYDVVMDLDGRVFDRLLKDRILAVLVCAMLGGFLKLLADVLPVFLDGIEIGGIFNEILVEIGNVLGLERMERYLEDDVLAGKMLRVVFSGEGSGPFLHRYSCRSSALQSPG